MPDQLLTQEQRQQLELLLAGDLSESVRRRAQLMLLLDDGAPTRQAAQAVGITPGRARHWRGLFRSQGMQIFLPGNQSEPPSTPEPTTSDQSTSQPVVSIQPSVQRAPLDQFLLEAKKIASPGVQPNDPLSEAGRKVLRYHFAQMLLHEEGTRLGDDIEELHDMRVATRRMRAAFEVFSDAFTEKAIKTHLKGLRATGRNLGRVRDLDVFMEKAHIYLNTLPPERQAELEPLLQSWAQERETDRERMVSFLDSSKYAEFKEEFLRFVTTSGAGARKNPSANLLPSRAGDIAPILIYTRLASVRAFNLILENASLEQFHALRIEFKKLRYTVEYFREVLGEESKLVINDLKMIQDHLGDLNDAHVATQILRDFLSVWEAEQDKLPVSQRKSPEPILAYLTYRYNELQHLMKSFQETWQYFNRPEFQQNLARAVAVL
jgi:CHAD domain-containing protein